MGMLIYDSSYKLSYFYYGINKSHNLTIQAQWQFSF